MHVIDNVVVANSRIIEAGEVGRNKKVEREEEKVSAETAEAVVGEEKTRCMFWIDYVVFSWHSVCCFLFH